MLRRGESPGRVQVELDALAVKDLPLQEALVVADARVLLHSSSSCSRAFIMIKICNLIDFFSQFTLFTLLLIRCLPANQIGLGK